MSRTSWQSVSGNRKGQCKGATLHLRLNVVGTRAVREKAREHTEEFHLSGIWGEVTIYRYIFRFQIHLSINHTKILSHVRWPSFPNFTDRDGCWVTWEIGSGGLWSFSVHVRVTFIPFALQAITVHLVLAFPLTKEKGTKQLKTTGRDCFPLQKGIHNSVISGLMTLLELLHFRNVEGVYMGQ